MPVCLHALFSFLRRPAAQACALVFGLGLVSALFFTPRFHNNDDVKMALTVSGIGVAPTPDPHLIYTNAVFVGLPLTRLYRAFPEAPWYAIYLVSAYAAGAMAFGVAVARAGWSPLVASLWALFLLAGWVPFLGSMQFTSAAFALGLGAGAMLWSHLWKPVSPPNLRAWLVAIVTLLLAANAVRRLVFPAALVFALVPSFVILACTRAERKAKAAFLGISMAIALVGGLAMNALDRVYFARSPGWENAIAYNDLRSSLNDYGKEHPYAAVGWTENDYRLFRSFFVWDESIYSIDRLRSLNDATKNQPSGRSWAGTRERLSMSLDRNRVPLAISFIVFCSVVGVIWKAPLSAWIFFASGSFLSVAMMGFLAYTGRLPTWVFQSLLLLAVAPAFFFAANTIASMALEAGRRRIAGLILLSALPLLYLSLRVSHRQSFALRPLEPRLEQARDKLASLGARVFVVAGSGWPFPLIPAFSKMQAHLPPAPLVALGPYATFPPTRSQLAALGGKDLYRDLVDKPGFYLLVPTQSLDAERVVDFLAEHRGVAALAEKVLATDFTDVYRIRRKGEAR